MTAQKKKKKQKSKKGLIALLILLASALIITIFLFSKQAKEKDLLNKKEAFIENMASNATEIAKKHDLYASVMIAQACLESNFGSSKLSNSPYYNYFGIKGTYKGKSVTFSTWEDDGSGNRSDIVDTFRSYDSPKDSLEDYANLLSSPYYKDVKKSVCKSYKNATKALTGTYATDSSYQYKLNELIEQYNLSKYD